MWLARMCVCNTAIFVARVICAFMICTKVAANVFANRIINENGHIHVIGRCNSHSFFFSFLLWHGCTSEYIKLLTISIWTYFCSSFHVLMRCVHIQGSVILKRIFTSNIEISNQQTNTILEF